MPADKELYSTPLVRILSPALQLVPPNSRPRLFESALEHFSSIPWCARLLHAPAPNPPSGSEEVAAGQGLGSGAAITFVPQCFNPASEHHDQFLGSSLASPRALRHVLCFFRPDDDSHLRDPARPIRRVSSLFALGEGLCGYRSIVHGGMISTMMDEAMGIVFELNTVLGKSDSLYASTHVTASLHIRFLRSLPAHGEVCVTAWLDGSDGRRSRLKCIATGSAGETFATCEATWASLKPNL